MSKETRERQRLRYSEIRMRVEVLEEEVSELRRKISLLNMGLADALNTANTAVRVCKGILQEMAENEPGEVLASTPDGI